MGTTSSQQESEMSPLIQREEGWTILPLSEDSTILLLGAGDVMNGQISMPKFFKGKVRNVLKTPSEVHILYIENTIQPDASAIFGDSVNVPAHTLQPAVGYLKHLWISPISSWADLHDPPSKSRERCYRNSDREVTCKCVFL